MSAKKTLMQLAYLFQDLVKYGCVSARGKGGRESKKRETLDLLIISE